MSPVIRDMSSSVEREFTFSFSLGGRKFVLRAPLKLPLDHPVPELAHRLILAHNLLCTVHEGKQLHGSDVFRYVIYFVSLHLQFTIE